DTMAAILHAAPPALSQSGRERSAELDHVIMQCLEKEPSRRFPSARELAAVLRGPGLSIPTGPAGQQQFETAAYAKTPPPTVPAPLAPSVAVLPFRNMSSDVENEYFSDGLADELI